MGGDGDSIYRSDAVSISSVDLAVAQGGTPKTRKVVRYSSERIL